MEGSKMRVAAGSHEGRLRRGVVRARVGLLVLLALVAPRGSARATEQLLAGTHLLVHDTGHANVLKLVAVDRGITVPTGSSAPTVAGATFVIENPLSGARATLDLPAAGWHGNRRGTTFTYVDPRLRLGLVTRAVIRNGRFVKVNADSTGVSLKAPQGALALTLRAGTMLYCFQFDGGAVRIDRPCKFVGRHAPVPAACLASPSGAFVAAPSSSPTG